MSNRITPLIDVSPVWERECSIYPDAIKIPMSDGKVVTYRMEVTQPQFHPSYQKAMEIVENMPIYNGYKAKHEEQKKPNLWLRIQRLSERKR